MITRPDDITRQDCVDVVTHGQTTVSTPITTRAAMRPRPFTTHIRHGVAGARHQRNFPSVVTATMPSYHAWAIFA